VWNDKAVPTYCNIEKSKCHRNAEGKMQASFCCEREHCHSRELCSYASDPLGPWLSKMAAAVHMVLLHGNKFPISLRYPQKLPTVLETASRKLKQEDSCRLCGSRMDGVAAVVADAAAYFSNVDADRCVANIKNQMRKCEAAGLDQIFFDNRNKKHAKLGSSRAKCPSNWSRVDFEELRGALDFYGKDNEFRIGKQCVRRLRGLPMGGALSPALASWDIECSLLQKLYVNNVLRAMGIQFRKESPGRILQFIVYVDDMLACSACLCNKCIENILPGLLPSDIGLEVESSSMGAGATFKFLHVEITTRMASAEKRCFFDVRPTLHNELFAFGKEKYPGVAKLEPFLGHNSAMRHDIQPFVFARLVMFETTLGVQNPADPFVKKHSLHSLVCLALEVLRLRWPKRWFASTVIAFPVYRKNWFACVARRFGVYVRHSSVLDVWCDDQTDFFQSFDAESVLRELACKAFRECVSSCDAPLLDELLA
jgi:hypothetical protein